MRKYLPMCAHSLPVAPLLWRSESWKKQRKPAWGECVSGVDSDDACDEGRVPLWRWIGLQCFWQVSSQRDTTAIQRRHIMRNCCPRTCVRLPEAQGAANGQCDVLPLDACFLLGLTSVCRKFIAQDQCSVPHSRFIDSVLQEPEVNLCIGDIVHTQCNRGIPSRFITSFLWEYDSHAWDWSVGISWTWDGMHMESVHVP